MDSKAFQIYIALITNHYRNYPGVAKPLTPEAYAIFAKEAIQASRLFEEVEQEELRKKLGM